MNLLLDVRRDDSETTVSVAGEIDLGSGQRLFEYAIEAVQRHGPQLAVDLGGVTFMDCGGVVVLLAIRSRVRRLGGQLSVVEMSGAVHKILDILGMDRTLSTSDETCGRYRTTELGSR